MLKHKIFTVALSIGLLGSLSACASTMAGAAGQAVAGSVATGALTSGSNRSRFSRLSCEQLEAEIAGSRRAMINPMTIPSTRAYIRDARAVAEEKGCGLDDEA